MGEYAAHYITLQAKDGDLKYQTPIRLTLPCELVVRESCAISNKETISAMLEAEKIAKNPNVKGYHDANEFFAALDE